MKRKLTIRRITAADQTEWLRLRQSLWPEHTPEEFASETDAILADPLQPVFVVERPDGLLGGLLEAGIRKYAEGCTTTPVGYIEAWYVDPDLRGQGIGRRLVQAAEAWAREQGLAEMASDTWLDNTDSIMAHQRLGYQESERLVHFVKKL